MSAPGAYACTVATSRRRHSRQPLTGRLTLLTSTGIYGDWHHAVRGVQLVTDAGAPTVTWANTFHPYGSGPSTRDPNGAVRRPTRLCRPITG
jgi:hypothetical protein